MHIWHCPCLNAANLKLTQNFGRLFIINFDRCWHNMTISQVFRLVLPVVSEFVAVHSVLDALESLEEEGHRHRLLFLVEVAVLYRVVQRVQTLEAEVVDEKLEVDFAVDHEEMVVHLMQSCKIHLDVSI